MPVYKTKTEKTKDNKIWYFKCNYRDIEGKIKQKKSKKFNTKEEATKEEAKFLLSIGKTKSNKSMTFNNIYHEFILKKEDEVRPTTLIKIKYHYKYIENKIGDIQISNLTIEQIKKWKNYMNSTKLSCQYKNKIFKLLCSLNNYSQRYYNVSTKVLDIEGKFNEKDVKKKEMLFFTIEEFNIFIAVIDSQMWKTLFEILFYCGLRQGELQALMWKDINFEQNTININKTLTTKLKGVKYSIFPPKTKSSYRIIPFTNTIKDDLMILYNIYSKLDGFSNDWFVFGGIRPTPESTIQIHKNKYCELANVKKIRIHDFRHSCASLLISKNADPVLVAKYLGHNDVSMTLNRYSHMYKSKLNEIIKLIEN